MGPNRDRFSVPRPVGQIGALVKNSRATCSRSISEKEISSSSCEESKGRKRPEQRKGCPFSTPTPSARISIRSANVPFMETDSAMPRPDPRSSAPSESAQSPDKCHCSPSFATSTFKSSFPRFTPRSDSRAFPQRSRSIDVPTIFSPTAFPAPPIVPSTRSFPPSFPERPSNRTAIPPSFCPSTHPEILQSGDHTSSLLRTETVPSEKRTRAPPIPRTPRGREGERRSPFSSHENSTWGRCSVTS